VIPPGGEGEIKVVLKTKGRAGKTKKRITVISNDPEHPSLFLNFEGEILVDVMVKPRHISFGQLGKKEQATREVTFDVAEPDKVKITGVEIEDEHFTVRKKSGDEKTSTWEVEFVGAKEIGRFNTKIMVALEGSDVEKLEVPVRAGVVGDLRYSRSLYFSKREGEFPSREVVFTTRSGKPVELKKVEDPDGKLKLTIDTPKGKKAVIKAEVADPTAKYEKPARHSFKVHTSDPDEPIVEIRYTITDRSGRRRPPLGPGAMKARPGSGKRGAGGVQPLQKAPLERPIKPEVAPKPE
jgi:hypothetical protein